MRTDGEYTEKQEVPWKLEMHFKAETHLIHCCWKNESCTNVLWQIAAGPAMRLFPVYTALHNWGEHSHSRLLITPSSSSFPFCSCKNSTRLQWNLDDSRSSRLLACIRSLHHMAELFTRGTYHYCSYNFIDRSSLYIHNAKTKNFMEAQIYFECTWLQHNL